MLSKPVHIDRQVQIAVPVKIARREQSRAARMATGPMVSKRRQAERSPKQQGTREPERVWYYFHVLDLLLLNFYLTDLKMSNQMRRSSGSTRSAF